jgi:ERCC4-related helicase
MGNVTFDPGDHVISSRFGRGQVEFDKGRSVIVRFDHGLEECEKATLTATDTVPKATRRETWDKPIEVITRIQAELIESINDTWGVFSPSRIELLPHQLWVCRQVCSTWPARYLVADDVGLGKTVEAGLILWPILAKGLVRRLLILCPAALVEQWQYRLRKMFDIRVAAYLSEADTEKADFWGTHPMVVASLQTLRAENPDRQRRLLESPGWDLLIVDEAHHVNADEKAGPTLGFALLKKLGDAGKFTSAIFFTGTPHRGKDFGFVSLLGLLRPDLFDPTKPLAGQIGNLRQVAIRNNKQSVTNLKGETLFQPPKVVSETYSYSPEEDKFYWMLSKFISTGKAYASSLSPTDARAVALVLISMQKLASSSVAAIRKALKRRLARILDTRQRATELDDLLKAYKAAEESVDFDRLSQMEEDLVSLNVKLKLMENEESHLRELIDAANAVVDETKIHRIVETVKTLYQGKSILFFSEYKATQSLLMSELIKAFGDRSVGFINGDERAEDVVNANGKIVVLSESRESAADRFNAGQVRFLVSTEAAGEGIDLQRCCHTLMHVDLPWNPMRLHQRVGRLNRYGQKYQVEVLTLRNPETVESRIWDKLNAKLLTIRQAFSAFMDEPEDLLQMVLGMSTPSLFNELFGDAPLAHADSLSEWFDKHTAKLGGRDVVEVVQQIVGNCQRFDYKQMSDMLPQLDLPALKPFFVTMLALNRRQIREEEDGLQFKTPDAWTGTIGIRSHYTKVVFERSLSDDESNQIIGVGHKLFAKALDQAKQSLACVTAIARDILPAHYVFFRIADQLTEEKRTIRSIWAAVSVNPAQPEQMALLQDSEALSVLNVLTENGVIRKSEAAASPVAAEDAERMILQTSQFLRSNLPKLHLPFKLIALDALALLWSTHWSPDKTN